MPTWATAFLDHLTQYGSAYTTLVTLGLLVATVVYVWLTRELLKENIRLRTAQTEPLVVVSATMERYWVGLEVRNAGAGVAYEVRLTPTPDAAIKDLSKRSTTAATKISDSGPFRQAIPCLPGNSVLTVRLFMVAPNWEPPEDALQVTATYVSPSGERRSSVNAISFGHLRSLIPEGNEMQRVVDELRNIERELGEIKRSLQPSPFGFRKV